MPIELGALAATCSSAWIASGQRAPRAARSRARSPSSKGAWRPTTSTIGELRRAALALRARNDRLDLSLTFLRNIARRLHGDDAEAAAQAALELIAARIGARAASVEMLAGGELVPLAVIGIWNREAPDRTALAALERAQPMRALELAEGGPHDSDIAAPITDATGERPRRHRGARCSRRRRQHGGASRPRRDRGLGGARALRRAARGRRRRRADGESADGEAIRRRMKRTKRTNNEESANPKPR